MSSGLTQVGRTLMHTPRRAMYAFLWRARPPEDVLRDASYRLSVQGPAVAAVVSPEVPPAR